MDGGGEQEGLGDRGHAVDPGGELHAAERVDADAFEGAGEKGRLALGLEDLHLGAACRHAATAASRRRGQDG